MNPTAKPHPDMYRELRAGALQRPLPPSEGKGVRIVLMDWAVENGTATVLASDDGSASLYFSSGGGFIGGGQRYPVIAEAARRVVRIGQALLPDAAKTDKFDLPPRGTVYFYFRTSDAVYLAAADEELLKTGTDPLSGLGAAMQAIISAYRVLHQPQPGSA